MATFKKMDEYANERDKNPYPNEYQDPKLKDEPEFYLQYARAMMADYVNNVCELPYAFGKDKRTFRELHQYATGSYPSTKIKDQLIGTSPKKKKDGKHITKMNISWDTLPVISKMYDVVREKNMNQEYDVDCTCVDDDSIQAKEADRALLKYLVQEDTKELIERTRFKPNVKLDPAAIGVENEDDVDLYFECGAYIFERELACIAACNKTKLMSKYKVIQDQTFDDLIKFGIAVWKNEIDLTTNTVKIRRVAVYNPELDRCPLILPFSETNNFENLSRCGEIRTVTISDIRKKYPHLNAQQLIYMAQCYSYLNPEYKNLISTYSNQYSDTAGSSSIDPLNRCKILILDFQFLGTDIENYVKNEKRWLYKSVDFDFKLSAESRRKGDKHIQKKVIKKHEAQWVIGTDILCDYGPSEDVIYYGPDGDRCPGLDFFATKTGNVSLVERSIGIQDDIDLANTKLRNAIATAVPAPRMIVQQGLLDNVFLNNIKQQPEDNMSVFRELGYLIVNAVDDNGKPIFTNQKLVDFLPMGIAEDINVFTGQILAGINNLREVWGIAQGQDGSTPQKYDGFKKTELSAQSSNAALFPTFNCFQYLFEDSFSDVVKKWQIIAKDRDLKLNYSPLGSKNLKVLSLNDTFTNADLNIALTLGSTDQELNALLQDIKELRALGIKTNFTQGITTSEYIYLYDAVKSGNIKQAMWVMAKVEKKKIAAAKAEAAQNTQDNIQGQQQSAIVAEKNKQDTIKMAEQEKRKTIILQGAENRKTAAASAYLKDFEKEGGGSAKPAYEEIVAVAQSEVDSVLQMDAADNQAKQQADQQQQNPQSDQENQPQPQQQVA